ncbi:ligand-binding sensor domain-containing protein [Pontibacter aydingkolensis]|uniref:T9SS type A sorting domain-containing protein n=1 Tax=Pontibacter aydingkolensis TaxID=1911536 RepID=A0ABS7CQP6_9BACT|nr:T9SS type A sorting domain-containing protein [Pontibacter aydingkolensis]MBW7465852.1 T9SS type A sorting domain-containing protein [Pontibacter aydingkolensis]
MSQRKPYSKVLKLLFSLLLLAGYGQSYGQSSLALGGWRLHVPYHQSKAIAVTDDKVYVAAEQGLYYYDKEFNSTQTISKIDGLSEQQISTIVFDKETSTLVIAYSNSNIDLVQKGKIINISDILRKPISGEKRIIDVSIHNKLAFISSTFGVVVLDLVKHEVRDSYRNLGPNGESVTVRAAAVLRDSIYLATNLGVLASKYSNTNLQDYHNWSSVNAGLPAPGTSASKLSVFDTKLYLSMATGGVYTLQNGSWAPSSVVVNGIVSSFTATDKYLSITTPTAVTVVAKDRSVRTYTHQLLKNAREAEVETNGTIWVADRQSGLVRIDQSSTEAAAFTPNGPYSSNSFKVYAYGGKMYVVSGGYSSAYLESGLGDGFYVYENGNWESFNRQLYPNSNDQLNFQDFVSVVVNPVTNKTYFASYGSGLIEWESINQIKRYDGRNSPLMSALSTTEKISYVRITSLSVDTEGNVWVVNRNQFAGSPGLHMLKPDGTWKSFVLPGVADGSNLDQILIDDYGQKWLSIARRANRISGLVVFDDEKNKVRQLSIGNGSGGLPNGDVYTIVKDLNGDVWVGTANGVGIYYNPSLVFTEQSYDARIPIVDRRPLLDGQLVRSIAVDGANRKWMGTDNGLWLFNPEGDKLIRHFNSSNSPLPSNKVVSVAVEHTTGEVFIATDAGVASYRGEATVTEEKTDCATVFPNPVHKNYTGLVGVSGLPNNANIRITDVAGTLVYKTRATGGTLAWDVRDYNGKRVKAGVYLVMSSSDDGSQTCISKIAVLD